MGTFATGCLLLNISDRKRSVKLPNLLVDTGSEATWIPRQVLNHIGIHSVKKASFRMANGRLIYRDVGYALVRVGERETADDIVFAETGDFAILGARALEGLNLWVDAAGKRLIPGRAWPLESVIVGGEKPGKKTSAAARHHKKVALARSAPANLPVSAGKQPKRKAAKNN
jgi:predicted aspartyl protease